MESRQTENKNFQHFKLKVGQLGTHWCQAQQNFCLNYTLLFEIIT